MRHTYIIDTSAFIADPALCKHFSHSDIIIPVAVLGELDKLKKQSNEAGKNARITTRLLDEYSNLGDVSSGVIVEDDVLLKFDTTYYNSKDEKLAGFGDPTYGDTQILYSLYTHWSKHPSNYVTLLSNDLNLRIKARARGMDAMGHESDNLDLSELYSGIKTVQDVDAGVELQQLGMVDPRLFNLELHPHECIVFEDEEHNVISMGRQVSPEKVKLVKKMFPWGLAARNKEQSCAIDMLMDRGIDLVTLVGKAGSGKTLVALAAALELVLEKKEYDKVIIYRPIQSVGNDLGYLPGTLEEKLSPWFQAIMDGFEFLLSGTAKSSKSSAMWKRELEDLKKRGKLEMEALTFIRGRSIPNAIIIMDECQNISSSEIKTLLTRAGNGTKICLIGDIEQVDNSNLDTMDNGLTYAVNKFMSCDFAGHVTFTEGERSRLATFAANNL